MTNLTTTSAEETPDSLILGTATTMRRRRSPPLALKTEILEDLDAVVAHLAPHLLHEAGALAGSFSSTSPRLEESVNATPGVPPRT